MAKHKQIIGYEGIYSVSSDGLIYNDRLRKPCKLHKSKNGYTVVNFCVNYKTKCVYVHRLVAEAFLSNQDNLKTVNHIDGDKSNNKLENLEWLSLGDNLRHAFKTGLKNVNHSKIIVIDNQTGIYHIGVKDAAFASGYSYSHLFKMLNGDRVNITSYVKI